MPDSSKTTTSTYPGKAPGGYRNEFAFAALKTDGSVVTWGSSESGGDSSSVAEAIGADGTPAVKALFSTMYAFAALREDGSVVTWGDTSSGGDSPPVVKNSNGASDVVQVFSTSRAFAALREDGSVVTWGNGGYGGDSSAVAEMIDSTSTVTQVFSTSRAFAALREDGTVVTWGNGGFGGDSSAVADGIDDTSGVTEVFSTNYAFTALRDDGSIVTWGDDGRGGDSSTVSGGVTDNGDRSVKSVSSTDSAFAALRDDGSVVTWGSSYLGGESSAVVKQINDDDAEPVTQVISTDSAFAALRDDGSVVTWGDSVRGGDSSSVADQLNGSLDVVQVFSTSRAFAALREDGSVVTWGDDDYLGSNGGGDSSAVRDAIDADGTTPAVTQVFSTSRAFAALRDDGSVVTWGDSDYGGDSSSVEEELNARDNTSKVTHVFPAHSAFTALRDDGSVVTWGDKDFGGDSESVEDELSSGVATIASEDSGYTLTDTLANLESVADAVLDGAESYSLTGTEFTAGTVTSDVAGLADARGAAEADFFSEAEQAIVDGAENAEDVDVFVPYVLEDTLANLESAAEGVVDGAIETVSYDATAPTVTGFSRLSESPTNAESVTFTVSFSEDVQNVAAEDFTLDLNGPTGASIKGVEAASASSFNVIVGGISGDGDIGLDLATTNEIVDTAGNALTVGEPETDQVYTIDNTAPNHPSMITPIEGDNVINANEDEDVVIAGTAESNATIDVRVADQLGNEVTAQTLADGSGNWTLDNGGDRLEVSGLEEGALDISVTQTDAAGNTSTAATETVSYDATAPGAPTINAAGAIKASDTYIAIAGTAESNATIEVTVADQSDNKVTAEVSADGEGEWTPDNEVTPQIVADGSSDLILENGVEGDRTLEKEGGRLDLSDLQKEGLDISVTQTDAAGNASTVATETVIMVSYVNSTVTVEGENPSEYDAVQVSLLEGVSVYTNGGEIPDVSFFADGTVTDVDGSNFTSNNRGLLLIGNSFKNALTGAGTNDIITGNGGADTLTGGGGADTFVFNDADGVAAIGSKSRTDSDGGAVEFDDSDVNKITDFNLNEDIIRFNGVEVSAADAGRFSVSKGGGAFADGATNPVTLLENGGGDFLDENSDQTLFFAPGSYEESTGDFTINPDTGDNAFVFFQLDSADDIVQAVPIDDAGEEIGDTRPEIDITGVQDIVVAIDGTAF